MRTVIVNIAMIHQNRITDHMLLNIALHIQNLTMDWNIQNFGKERKWDIRA
jgi:hypothetical protein